MYKEKNRGKRNRKMEKKEKESNTARYNERK